MRTRPCFSIDGAFASDYFKVTTGVALTLTPVGSTYLNAALAGDGSCPMTGTINALIARDLTLSLLQSDGTTLIATSNIGGVGAVESFTSVALPTQGVYYIQVSSAYGSGVQSHYTDDRGGPLPCELRRERDAACAQRRRLCVLSQRLSRGVRVSVDAYAVASIGCGES